MADEIAAAPVAAPAPAPVAAAPVAAPAAAPLAAPAPAAAAPAAAEPLANLFDDPAEKPPGEEGEKPPAEEAKPDGDPVYELTLPEGLELPDEMLSGVKAKLAAAKVSPDQAQTLFDEYTAAIKSTGDRIRADLADGWTNTQKAWRAEIAADKEIGGAKQEGVIAQIRKGAETLLGSAAAKELYTALNITGAGNNPAIVRALNKAFSLHAPATSVTGAPAGNTQAKSAGSTMYPNQGKTSLGNSNL